MSKRIKTNSFLTQSSCYDWVQGILYPNSSLHVIFTGTDRAPEKWNKA